MIQEKHKILRRSGSPVEITDLNGTVTSTVAMVGRASKQFNSTLALEHYRRAHFLPSIDIKSGYLCYSIPADETYLLVATYPDIIAGRICTNVSHMMICNSTIDVKGEVEEGDGRGNLIRTPTVKYQDLKVHAQLITQDLRMYNPGLHPDAKYLIYSPGLDMSILDSVTIKVLGKESKYKIVAIDYTSFPGCSLIQVKTETRVR